MAKKIRLLSSYNGLGPNSIITLDDATADKLLAGGVGATTDLTGGVVRYLDSDGSIASGQISAQQRVTISVPVGSALTLKGTAQAQGTLETLNSAGTVLSSRRLRSGSVGPLPGGKSYRVAVDFGTFQTSTQDIEEAYPQAPRFDIPVKVATWGDSLTDSANAATHDLTRADMALWDGKDMYASRLATNLLQQSGGTLIPVANCGLGGTTSTQIIARDDDPAGVNRRGAMDAANLGAKVCIISLGRNDILQNVRANTSASAVQSTLDTIYANVVTAVKRVQRLGMYPILREFAGYGYENVPYNYAVLAGLTPADVDAQKAAINTAARHIRDVIVPTLGEMYLLPIREGMVDASGTWYPQYTTDGLHENRNGAAIIARRVVDFVLSMARPYTKTGPYAPLPAGVGGVNAFANPAANKFTTPGSRLAGFIDTGTGAGTVTGTWSISEDQDGTVWQNLTCVAQTFDGTVRALAPSGLASYGLAAQMMVFGATPELTVKAGDLVRVEFDYIIDDGNGGAPLNVLSWYSQVSIGHSTNQFYRIRPMEQNNSNLGLLIPDSVISGKLISPPIVMPFDSASLTNGLVQLVVYLGDTRPARIRVANHRFIKWTNN